MAQISQLSNNCPMTQEPIQLLELANTPQGRHCLLRTERWTTGVFPSKAEALRWVEGVCKGMDSFMAGSKITERKMRNSAGQPQQFFIMSNDSKGWSGLVRGRSAAEASYRVTGLRPGEYNPDAVTVTRNEEDSLTPTDDAMSGMGDITPDDVSVDDLLAEGRSLTKKHAKAKK